MCFPCLQYIYTEEYSRLQIRKYLLNRNDGTTSVCSINVYGGIFVGFNPADNCADGEHTNYVAPGYKSEKITYNEKAAWKVVKE